jgi:hypothetical protein
MKTVGQIQMKTNNLSDTGSFDDLAKALGGAGSTLSSLSSFKNFAQAVESGDAIAIAQTGNAAASLIIRAYQGTVLNQINSVYGGLDNLRDIIKFEEAGVEAARELAVTYDGAASMLESLSKGLPFLQLLSGLKSGDPISILAGGALVGDAYTRVNANGNACRNTIKPIALRAMSMPGRRLKGFKTMHRNCTYQLGKRITMKTIALCADSMPGGRLKGLK